MTAQFDWYSGGGVDVAFEGAAQVDAKGNVNVSKFNGLFVGCGGFIDITQHAGKVVYCGTFTAAGLKLSIADGKLTILHEGKVRKYIKAVEQVTFSGDYAGKTRQPVLFITERAVFTLQDGELALTEVAPGIDIDRDILAHMDFRPIVRDPVPMDTTLFRPEPMALAHILLGMSLSERITYDPARNTMFINWEGFEVRTTDEVELVRREVETRCRAIGRKLAMVINYDQFYLDPAVSDAFFSMITYLQQRYYTTASRYTTSAFMRLKLGASLAERELAPHVFETFDEAQSNAVGEKADELGT
jgi:propionate CoA-transferase